MYLNPLPPRGLNNSEKLFALIDSLALILFFTENGLLPSYAKVKFLIFAPKPRRFLFEYISFTSSLDAKVSNGNSNSISFPSSSGATYHWL